MISYQGQPRKHELIKGSVIRISIDHRLRTIKTVLSMPMSIKRLDETQIIHSLHRDCSESRTYSCQVRDLAIVNLIDPQSDRYHDEKNRQLYGDGEDQYSAVGVTHGYRCADPLEGLPAELLSKRVSTEYRRRDARYLP